MKRAAGAVPVLDLEPDASDFLAQAIAGLSSSPRTLPSKFFYDERGSDLFQKICELPEYYVTRTETEILRRHAPEMAASIGENAELVGFGTGAGVKTRMLLEHLEGSDRLCAGRHFQTAPDGISRGPQSRDADSRDPAGLRGLPAAV